LNLSDMFWCQLSAPSFRLRADDEPLFLPPGGWKLAAGNRK
jgi:hypothetical protein